MPPRKRSTPTTRFTTAKKSTPVGTSPAFVLAAESGQTMALSYWDLWFALVANANFDSNWDRFVEHLRSQQGASSRLAERKLSHIRDLQRRLQQVDVKIRDIVAQANPSPAELRRAQNQVLKREPREHEWSEAMRHTPRQRRYAHAMRGFWPSFPVSPASYAVELASRFHTRRWFSASQSSRIADRLDEFVELADSERHDDQHAQAQAMLRAFLTVVIELMEVADDSYGSLGDSFHGGFTNYLAIPLKETGIEETVFFHDLLTLLIWEDYGLTYDRMDGYFERLTSEAGDLCMAYLRQQIEELQDDELDYQAEKALTWLGHIATEQNRFELFEELAKEMGTRAWKRIIVLADRAVKKRKRKLAVTVFDAALGPGMHERFLREKYEQLQRGKWNPDPRK
ncbi:MAG: hypothetical protein V3S24_18150 [Candidatus Tectomicrobia bacterium]